MRLLLAHSAIILGVANWPASDFAWSRVTSNPHHNVPRRGRRTPERGITIGRHGTLEARHDPTRIPNWCRIPKAIVRPRGGDWSFTKEAWEKASSLVRLVPGHRTRPPWLRRGRADRPALY